MTTKTFPASGKSGCFIVVDEADWPRVSQFKWYACRRYGSHTKYVQAEMSIGGARKMVYLHRFLLEPPPDLVVDHIDGDALNNSRANLRVVTQAENQKAAARLPGRYGNTTLEGLDRELAEFEARTER